jgi:ATP-binding cassette subfamily B protein
MTDLADIEDDDAPRKRVLTNTQVLGFIAGRWMRRPVGFFGSAALMLCAVAADLALPWASGALVEAVAQGPGGGRGRRMARLGLLRRRLHPLLPVAERRLPGLEPLRRAQHGGPGRTTASPGSELLVDWHADTFAGSTVRKLSRPM